MTRPLVGTYRLQLRPSFGFLDAAAIVPYLRDLGVSHLYLSPCFEATRGSTHGYDVVDPNRLRSELGGPAAFDELVATAQRCDLGVVIDIVPHHMAATAANDWWWSVLELGQDSPYAAHFDIDWDSREERLRGVVLLPVLGDHYGRVLDAGDLQLTLDHDRIVVHYFEHVAPLSPETADELWAEAGRRGCQITDVIAEVNADIDRLDALLDRQHHRFARWQAAAHDLDYRRFFDIDSLVALRSERADVFDDTHCLTAELVRSGRVDGVRVDHIDGLRDPGAYLMHLRAALPDAWIIVEKILRADEHLPETWSTDGTTGYDFLADVTGVLLDPDGVQRLIEEYAQFTSDASTYAEAGVTARRDALQQSLDPDLRRVVSLLVRVCEQNRRWRDFTRAELRDALAEICVHAPAYRSYVRPGADVTLADRAFVVSAVERASAARPDLDTGLLEFLREVLLGELPSVAANALVERFQQLTGPVAAKGEEDTAFYRWIPLLCLNDVGTQPDAAVISVDEFHERARDRQLLWPRTMLTTSTHDTKRSEDVRARLAVLSEAPLEWAAAVDRWHAMNDCARVHAMDAPDRHDEWFIYQTLAGAHPLPRDRAWTVIQKSMREAKRRTDWVRLDEAYEGAVHTFVDAILADDAFVADLNAEVEGMVTAGHVNALTQLVLRLLCPGIPDTYQGCELWDSSLVDPDNRREIDFLWRVRELDAIADRTFDELWMTDRAGGRPKLSLLRTGLGLRRRHAPAFGPEGSYEALPVSGVGADRVIAFRRSEAVAVVVARWPRRGLPDDALIDLPDRSWTNVLTGKPHGGTATYGELRGDAPFSVLETDVDPVV